MTSLAKKVIALVLCVSMFAGMAAMAFAEEPAVKNANPYDYYEQLRKEYMKAMEERYAELQVAYALRYLQCALVVAAQQEAYTEWALGVAAISTEQYLALNLEYEAMKKAAEEFNTAYETAKKTGAAAAEKAVADAQKALGSGELSPEEAIAQAKSGVTEALDTTKATVKAAAEDYAEYGADIKDLHEDVEAELKRQRKRLQEELERKLREAQALAAANAAE